MTTTRKGFLAALVGAIASTFGVRRLIDVSDAWTGEGFICPTVVTLDGVNVSDYCYRAEKYSDGSGKVRLFLRDANGSYKFDHLGGIAVEERAGEVEIIRPKLA